MRAVWCSLLALSPACAVPLRLGLEWFLNADHLPLVVALREGFFADAGLEVTLVEPQDHWEAETEILEGRIDVAVTEPLHLAIDAAAGKPVLGFARFLHTDGGVMFLRGGNITRPRDMCGATISYPGSPGPGGPAIVRTMIEADGGVCDPSSFARHNGGFFHTDALALGDADVATLVFANFEVVEARSRGLAADFFSLKDWGVPDFCQLVLFTTPERFSELKPQLRLLVLALRRATSLIHRNPARARAAWQQHLRARVATSAAAADAPKRSFLALFKRAMRTLSPVQFAQRARAAKADRDTMTATLPAFPNDNSLAADYFTGLMHWLVSTGQVERDQAHAAAPYWTNEIAL